MEQWRDVTHNANYLVSDTGKVRRRGSDKDHSMYKKKGYLVIDLYENGQRSKNRVNRLVAEAFIPNPDNKPEVNHKDGDKSNNCVSNLEWVTKKENCRHAWDNGLVKPSYSMLGKKNPNGGRKGKPIRVVETGEVFNTLKECEEAINGNNRHINDCLRGRQNTHRGFHFEYVND
jgi:hypothetical protein